MNYSTTILSVTVAIALLFWWLHPQKKLPGGQPGQSNTPPELVPFRTAGGILQTNGLTKTETLQKETGSWRGKTASSIRFNATYRYEIELRGQDWNILIDDTRHVAFVVAPAFRPQLPVAVDSHSVMEWTTSGWARFDKWEHLQSLREQTSTYLEGLAKSPGYIELARGQARITVEEFASDWLLKSRGWPEDAARFVKVYFADEPDIPFPKDRSIKDFLP